MRFIPLIEITCMKSLYLFILVFLPAVVAAQSGNLKGRIVDESTGTPVEYGIVLEYSRQVSTYSDRQGQFTVETFKGDTVVLSALGYYYCKVIVTDSLLHVTGPVIFKVSPRLYEISEARIVSLGTYSEFRKNFINLHQDNQKTEELAENINKSSTVAAQEGYEQFQQERERNGITLMSIPIRSPEDRERIRLAKIIQTENIRDQVYRRFNPDLVKRVTGLTTDDDIIEFMVFCDFTDKFILENTEETLIAQMRLKYDAFKVRKQMGKAHMNPLNLNTDTNNPFV
jgi:hypothetical protein